MPRPAEPARPPAPTAAELKPSRELATPPATPAPRPEPTPIAAPAREPLRNIYFDAGGTVVGAEGQAALQRAADWLKGNPRKQITLVGHTDDTGSREMNVALALRRVEAVADALIALGTPARQIRRVSYGNERAGAERCVHPTCLATQRRVELRYDE